MSFTLKITPGSSDDKRVIRYVNAFNFIINDYQVEDTSSSAMAPRNRKKQLRDAIKWADFFHEIDKAENEQQNQPLSHLERRAVAHDLQGIVR